MVSASMASSLGASSIAGNDSSVSESFIHYDIREPDSLMEDPSKLFTIESTDSISIASLSKEGSECNSGLASPVSRLSVVRSFVSSDSNRKPGVASFTQTVPNSEPEELQQLRSELIPTLETELSIRDSHIAASDSSVSTLLSRLTYSVLFEPARMRLVCRRDWLPIFFALDSTSIDVFDHAVDASPTLSFPLRTCAMKVSGRLGELQLFSLKVHKASFQIDDSIRFKKTLFSLKLIGVPVSIIDVPSDLINLKQESSNPRRTARGD